MNEFKKIMKMLKISTMWAHGRRSLHSVCGHTCSASLPIGCVVDYELREASFVGIGVIAVDGNDDMVEHTEIHRLACSEKLACDVVVLR